MKEPCRGFTYLGPRSFCTTGCRASTFEHTHMRVLSHLGPLGNTQIYVATTSFNSQGLTPVKCARHFQANAHSTYPALLSPQP